MATRVAHFNIRVADAQRSVSFYRKLGLKVVGCLVLSPSMYLLYLGTEEVRDVAIELTINDASPAGYDRSPGSGHVALGVGNLDAMLSRLAAEGIHPESAPFHPGGRKDVRVCFVVDPDGVRVELAEGEFRTPKDPLPSEFAT